MSSSTSTGSQPARHNAFSRLRRLKWVVCWTEKKPTRSLVIPRSTTGTSTTRRVRAPAAARRLRSRPTGSGRCSSRWNSVIVSGTGPGGSASRSPWAISASSSARRLAGPADSSRIDVDAELAHVPRQRGEEAALEAADVEDRRTGAEAPAAREPVRLLRHAVGIRAIRHPALAEQRRDRPGRVHRVHVHARAARARTVRTSTRRGGSRKNWKPGSSISVAASSCPQIGHARGSVNADLVIQRDDLLDAALLAAATIAGWPW